MGATASNMDLGLNNASPIQNYSFDRPATAGTSRLAQSVENLKLFATVQQEQQHGYTRNTQRPSTAGPLKTNTLNFGTDTRGSPSPNDWGNNGSIIGTINKAPQVNTYNQAFTPLFVEKDKQVARFYGHFFQARTWEKDGPLGDPVIETNQCRRVTIFYYLIDNTIEISEPKTANSGEAFYSN
jgi:hypothetical protein